tara:strand:+ start:556 stop:798 length:243 start_codon:yes stop_codon:yes gene_type:complete
MRVERSERGDWVEQKPRESVDGVTANPKRGVDKRSTSRVRGDGCEELFEDGLVEESTFGGGEDVFCAVGSVFAGGRETHV